MEYFPIEMRDNIILVSVKFWLNYKWLILFYIMTENGYYENYHKILSIVAIIL